MANGIEKRRFKRMKADLSLNVSSLFKQDNMEIKNLDSPIKVINISEGGIAFESKSMLPINFYFNAALNLGSETDTLYSVVKIIRSQPIEGTDFIFMAASLSVWHRFLVISLMNTKLRLRMNKKSQ